ncbi:LysM repeat protein [Evansella vedderi]|uniref:LysM repeat protein n=1 Tax=Evansella vedderi TaxID=38282 RepID=A0ABT9ZU04_9BACI|nr:LysM peptidoglycan-binding domain-containing protein [Evansella vedderi]MDQ0254713.1 LysM repeat protein [Evansella vedderi]
MGVFLTGNRTIILILLISLLSACTQQNQLNNEWSLQQEGENSYSLEQDVGVDEEGSRRILTENNVQQQTDGEVQLEENDERYNKLTIGENKDLTIDYNEDFLGKLEMEMGREYNGANTPDVPGALSGSGVNLVVDGARLNLSPTPLLDNGNTLIPIRAISTHFGAGVSWDERTRTVGIRKGDTNISFVVGSTLARVNGRQVSVPPSRIINGSTFVPIRFISETFGYEVQWNNGSRTVSIDTTPKTNNTTPSPTSPQTPTTYTVVAGDSLWSIANRFGLTVDELRSLNNLTGDTIRVGQTLIISRNGSQQESTPEQTQMQNYTVVSGDSLSGIASRFNTTVNAIKTKNNLTSDVIRVGQVLRIPGAGSGGSPNQSPQQGVTKTYITHTVRSGDNAWNLSIQYGIPMLELLKENNLTINSVLQVGQRLTIPVYDVPVRPVVSSRHGELLDWWTEARYVFPIGRDATITDFATGTTFRVRHTMGGNHADAEPITSTDAQTMRQVWGGNFSWTPRAVIVSVDGRRLAAAMHSFPHGDHSIRTNNYNGHFCIHFLNSTRHNDGLIQDSMQRQVRIAAGVN